METYKANCHCGQIKFAVTLPDIKTTTILRCNCSVCIKNGYLLVYPKKEDVQFVCGKDKITLYRFGGGNKPHSFCSRCGTSLLIDFSEADSEIQRAVTAVNVGDSKTRSLALWQGWMCLVPKGMKSANTLLSCQIRTFVGMEDLMGDLELKDVDGKHKIQPPYKAPW